MGLLRCFASVKRCSYFPAKIFSFWLKQFSACVFQFFFFLNSLCFHVFVILSPFKKKKGKNFILKMLLLENCILRTFLHIQLYMMKKIVFICFFHCCNGQFHTDIHTLACANTDSPSWLIYSKGVQALKISHYILLCVVKDYNHFSVQ